MEIFNVKWSKSIYLTSLFVVILLLAVTYWNYYVIGAWGSFLIPVVLFALIYAAYLSPIKIIITDDVIILRKMIGKKIFWIKDIESIKPHQLKGSNVRTCGCGGVFGYTGNYYNKGIGKYISYVGNYDQTFLITMNTGKKYLLSCQDSEKFTEIINTKIQKTKTL